MSVWPAGTIVPIMSGRPRVSSSTSTRLLKLKAKLAISSENGDLLLQLRNDGRKSLDAGSFTPRSIADRAAALGGKTLVYADKHETVISVQIPL